MKKLDHQNFHRNMLIEYLEKDISNFELQIVSKFSTILYVSNFMDNFSFVWC